MKRSQDGEAVILRLAEVDGKETQAKLRIDAALVPAGAAVTEVDAMEQPLKAGGDEAVGEAGDVTVEVPAYGVANIRLG